MFKCEVIGNLGADAKVMESNGSKFVAFRVAHTSKVKQQDGSERESTTWLDVTMNDTEAKVIPYLKQGVKVFVRGNASLRVFSSPKDKMMKAGCQINAWEVELCGGTTDEVPRQLINPDTAQLLDVSKYYWVNMETKGMKSADTRPLVDSRGRQYVMNYLGFVKVLEEPQQQESEAK